MNACKVGRGHRLQRAALAVITPLWCEIHQFDGLKFPRGEYLDFRPSPLPYTTIVLSRPMMSGGRQREARADG